MENAKLFIFSNFLLDWMTFGSNQIVFSRRVWPSCNVFLSRAITCWSSAGIYIWIFGWPSMQFYLGMYLWNVIVALWSRAFQLNTFQSGDIFRIHFISDVGRTMGQSIWIKMNSYLVTYACIIFYLECTSFKCGSHYGPNHLNKIHS